MLNIHKLLTPYNHTEGSASRIKYIVIHYVGATGGAKANCEYYAGGNRHASAHYYVDFDGSIWQSVEDKNVAWSVGGKKYPGTAGGSCYGICTNQNSLNIEMCVRNKGSLAADSRDWYFEDATVAATIELTKYLMQKYNIDADHVIRHYDVTGKICPNPYVLESTKHKWTDFKAAISRRKEPETVEPGWRKAADGKRWWYENADRTWKTGWQRLMTSSGEYWFYFDAEGYMLTGWQRIKDRWYYLDTTEGSTEGALWHEADDRTGALEVWKLN